MEHYPFKLEAHKEQNASRCGGCRLVYLHTGVPNIIFAQLASATSLFENLSIFSWFVSPKKKNPHHSHLGTKKKTVQVCLLGCVLLKNVSRLWSALFAARRLLAPGSSRVAVWPDHDPLPAIPPTAAAEASCLPWKKFPPPPPSQHTPDHLDS